MGKGREPSLTKTMASSTEDLGATSSSMAGVTQAMGRQPGGVCTECSSAGLECVWSDTSDTASCERCEETGRECVQTTPMGPPPKKKVRLSPIPHHPVAPTRSGYSSEGAPSTSQQSTSAGPDRSQNFSGLVADVSGKFKSDDARREAIFMNVTANTSLQIDRTLRDYLQAKRDGEAEAASARVNLHAAVQAAGILAGAAILATRAQPRCSKMSRHEIHNAQWNDNEEEHPGGSSPRGKSRGGRSPSR